MFVRSGVLLVAVFVMSFGAAGCGSNDEEGATAKTKKAEKATSDDSGDRASDNAGVASEAERASADRAMFNVKMAHSTMVGCFAAKKPSCDNKTLISMSSQLAEPIKLGDAPGGVTIKSNSADGKLGRENYAIGAKTIDMETRQGVGPIYFTAGWDGADDRFTCSLDYADVCLPGDDGYNAWPADS